MIVHLNGWPGVGKFTVGKALAERLGARLIHNHLLHDVAIVCAGFQDADRWPLYEAVREAAYAALARRPASEVFVMTNALCVNSARERAAWHHVVDLAMKRNVPLIPIVLSAEFEENARRIGSAERSGYKLADAEVLRAFMQIDSIQRPNVPELLELDVTNLSAEEAAEALAGRVAALAERGLRAATDDHRQLKNLGAS